MATSKFSLIIRYTYNTHYINQKASEKLTKYEPRWIRLTAFSILLQASRPPSPLNQHPCWFTFQTLSRLQGRGYGSNPARLKRKKPHLTMELSSFS